MKHKKVYGYMRVSTKEQREDRQLDSLLAQGVPRRHIYMDKLSGKDFERPQYKKLLRKLDENFPLDSMFCNKCGVLTNMTYDVSHEISDLYGTWTNEKNTLMLTFQSDGTVRVAESMRV